MAATAPTAAESIRMAPAPGLHGRTGLRFRGPRVTTRCLGCRLPARAHGPASPPDDRRPASGLAGGPAGPPAAWSSPSSRAGPDRLGARVGAAPSARPHPYAAGRGVGGVRRRHMGVARSRHVRARAAIGWLASRGARLLPAHRPPLLVAGGPTVAEPSTLAALGHGALPLAG